MQVLFREDVPFRIVRSRKSKCEAAALQLAFDCIIVTADRTVPG